MSQADSPRQTTESDEEPEDVVAKHRDTIEEAIDRDLPGADRLKNLLTTYGGDE